jgi:hypothetical protein
LCLVSGRRAIRLSAAGVAALALAGCGLTGGGPPTGVSVLVTNGFGAQIVSASGDPRVADHETVLRLLEGATHVATLGGGATVESIDGFSAHAGERWFYFVNGVGHRSPETTRLHSGDHVWWDRHDARVAASIPAVVGSFPEPFVDGVNGKHLPLRIECTAGERRPCNAIQSAFARLKLAAFEGCLLCSQYNESLRVVVGPAAALRVDPAAARLADGPAASGVYARFEDGGRRLALLDAAGRTVRTVGPGAGLIAATRYMGQPPVWYVTGTDARGVAQAAQAFNAGTLDGHFAIAVAGDEAIPLPDASS